ncbi:MAG TPA: T9SS type A sorting domain-containing protein [Bacteroidia bacterium]|nr:T9SS type A sorting domain-containing protein [Bacteroidia bacterium]
MRNNLLIILFITNCFSVNSQCINDSYSGFGGTYYDKGHSIISDSLQNVFLAGYFTESIQLGNFTLTSDSIGEFLCKISPAGNILWAKTIFNNTGNYYSFYPPRLKIDHSGQLLVAGTCQNTNSNFDTISNAFTNGDLFIARFNPGTGLLNSFISTGRHLWTFIMDFDIDNADNIYLAGSFVGIINFGGLSLSCVGQTNSFLVKFNSQNQAIWLNRITTVPTTTGNFARSINYDNYNHIYVSGWYGLNADFGNGISLTSPVYQNGFIAKYNINGNVEWAKTSDTSKSFNHQIVNDTNSITLIERSPDAFVNYNQDGDTVWTKIISGNNNTANFTDFLEFNGKCYLVGNFSNTLNIQGNIFTGAWLNSFVASFDLNGDFDWARIFQSTSGISFNNFTIDNQSTIHIIGDYAPYDTINQIIIMPWWGNAGYSGSGEILYAKLCNAATTISENISENNFMNIFPNPASSEFQISNFAFQTGNEIIFSDITGKILFTKRISNLTSDFRLLISDFSNGIYFLEVKTNEGVLNKKVLVQH